ncbi:SIMPL domain-containing protein [Roseibium salinum]|uniref:SIMPL domain-containing protein n=1 Tax=Roseibium salinum TaxID=1604349 RepID=A0ABT3QY13_9HYPH|nr:SIMPL domain-containing protein [Roseibium sp. DSM 29163]MCX2721733.1 SIMPL domain-containing protein [Roseibium sp. DSM 29163]
MKTLPDLLPRRGLTIVRNAALAAGLTAALAITVPAVAQEAAPAGTITMEGEGTVAVAPDMAVITASVVTTAKTASGALADNSAAIAKAIEAIKSHGIEPKDIQTRGFNISPRYERNDNGGDRQPNIIGYEVRNGVEVNVRDLARLGDLLTLVVESGANSVDGIRFEVSDPEEKLDEARTKAVEAARHKAEVFAAAAGVDLGNIDSIIETGIRMPRPLGMRAEGMMMARADAVPIEAGEQSISATVTIRWTLK